MTIAIIVLMLLAYLLIATEHVTHINKATTAMFAGVVGWILYIIYVGPDKAEIAEHVFVRHSAYFCSIVLYLLSTMAIVEVLSDNGCFDFVSNFLRTRSMPRFLWGTVLITFLLSANLDNLTTVVLMLIIVRRLLANRRQRLYVGAAVVVAAVCTIVFSLIFKPSDIDCSTLKYYRHQIFRRDYLFQKEGKYKGNTLRTHAGGAWLDGYSDHLPTVVYVVKEAHP